MNDKIEQDDLRFEELLDLQSMTVPEPEPSSVEEKYEEELTFQKIAESIISRLGTDPIVECDGEDDEEW